MSTTSYADADLIMELRLRRWARKNYVAVAERRDDSWHPIVLDEMQRKDAEVRELDVTTTVSSTSFVPLVPTTFHTVHIGHRNQRGPKADRVPQRTERYVGH